MSFYWFLWLELTAWSVPPPSDRMKVSDSTAVPIIGGWVIVSLGLVGPGGRLMRGWNE